VEALLATLAAYRRRLRAARALDAGLKGAFYASLAAAAGVAAAKATSIGVSPAALGAVAAVPLALAARAAARTFSLRDCAIELDRRLGLEERLATAVEGAGPFRELQGADAAAAFARAKIPPRRLPREARLLAGSALLLAALLAIPSAGSGEDAAADDEALRPVLEAEAARLEAIAQAGPIEFREVAELLRRGEAQVALERLEALREKLEARLLAEAQGPGRQEALRLRDAAGAAAEALAARLGRLGRRPPAARTPEAAAAKLERQRVRPEAAPMEEDGPAAAGAPPGAAVRMGRTDWDPKYDAVIRRYFRSVP
jgi:hypothetical protein